MARSRNIKPSFFKNESLAELPYEFRLLFIGLWTLADREGRLEDRPKRIKMELFPADNIDVDLAINSLCRDGFLIRYESEKIKCIQVVNFKKHQNPHCKESPSTLPAPCLSGACTVQAGLIPDSFNLIPDSPISDSQILEENTMSDKSDDLAKNARKVLEYLNNKTGKGFRFVDTNLKLIRARINEGISVADLIAIIDRKYLEWNGTKWEKYLRPATLFNNEKCNQYAGELTLPSNQEESERKLREWLGDDDAIEGEVL